MVMEASPTSSLEVPEPELLFPFLVVPLDAPAQLRERDEAVEGDVFRNGSKPELRGLLLLSWPFDQEPFLIPGNASIEAVETERLRADAEQRRLLLRRERLRMEDSSKNYAPLRDLLTKPARPGRRRGPRRCGSQWRVPVRN